MDNHQSKAVLDIVENEGFEYAFVNFSDFDDIENEEFHKLRKAYLDAREKLAECIGFSDRG